MDVPNSLIRIFDFVQDSDIVRPGNLCRHCLYKLAVWICCRKPGHILQIADGVSLDVGESDLDVFCETVDEFAAPHFVGVDHFSDRMIEEDQFLVDADSRFILGRLDLGFDLLYCFKRTFVKGDFTKR